jgi:hypothetical protein
MGGVPIFPLVAETEPENAAKIEKNRESSGESAIHAFKNHRYLPTRRHLSVDIWKIGKRVGRPRSLGIRHNHEHPVINAFYNLNRSAIAKVC